jgi:signal transduction histidine kinase
LWFAAAHIVVLVVLRTQQVATDNATLFAIFTLGFLMFPGGKSSRRDSLYGRPGGAEQLRSRYEQQIREAGAQTERNRLARELHDSIKQQIFVIQTAAATAQTRFETDRTGAESALDQIRSSAREAMTEMEAMMDQLRAVPLDNAGLVDALKKQCEALGHRTGAHVEFTLGELPPNETLAPGSHQAILRVAQESLANIARHARASNVTVSLHALNDRLTLRVHDDGTGFDPFQSRRGMRITNMRERAEEFGGQFDLTSSQGNGTTVTLTLPHDEIPTGYRKRTFWYGAGLVALLVFALRFHNSYGMALGIMCALELVRGAADWLRARRYTEAKA